MRRHTDLSSCGQSALKYIDVALVAKSICQRLGFLMLDVVKPAQGILDGLEPARVWLPPNRHDRGIVRQNFADTRHADFKRVSYLRLELVSRARTAALE